MADATGETSKPIRVAFKRRIKLEFHSAQITSDSGLLAYRELDGAFGLTMVAASRLAEGRCGRYIRRGFSVCSGKPSTAASPNARTSTTLGGSPHDPAMRAIVGQQADRND